MPNTSKPAVEDQRTADRKWRDDKLSNQPIKDRSASAVEVAGIERDHGDIGLTAIDVESGRLCVGGIVAGELKHVIWEPKRPEIIRNYGASPVIRTDWTSLS